MKSVMLTPAVAAPVLINVSCRAVARRLIRRDLLLLEDVVFTWSSSDLRTYIVCQTFDSINTCDIKIASLVMPSAGFPEPY